MQAYRWRGARALVLLHDRAMRELIVIWRRSRAAGTRLPQSEDPAYASLETLLHHALDASRSYMMWLCRKLGLPDPAIDPAPAADRAGEQVDRYLEHLLERWRLPLTDMEESSFFVAHKTDHEDMSCEAMLEHAVMHPVRHRFQLEELAEAQVG